MPKRKTVNSLEHLCFEYVAKNSERIWAMDYTAKSNLGGDLSHDSVGPFDILAGSLLQELLELMGEMKCLTSALLLHSLILPQLKQLNLTACPQLVNRDIVHSIQVRCKCLSSLVLHGCDKIPADALADLVKALPKLKKLDLSETQCNSYVLSTVGASCQQLCELNISDCERLSLDSLLYLAYNPNTGSVCCPTLQRLIIYRLEPSTDSREIPWALGFVLLALPNLKSVNSEWVTEAVCLIYEEQFNRNQFPPGFPSLEMLAKSRLAILSEAGSSRLMLPLKELCDVSNSDLPRACAVCPHLSEISVTVTPGLGFVQNLLSLRHLTHLRITCWDGRDLRELLPVTANLGIQLTCLSICGFSYVDGLSFHTLLNHCPILKELNISVSSSWGHRQSQQPTSEAFHWDASLSDVEFPQLSAFGLVCSLSKGLLPPQHIRILRQCLVSLLRGSPYLQSLRLIRIPFSLDWVFEKIQETSRTALRHLSKLMLIRDEVSPCILHQLLSSDNQLTFIKLHKCLKITEMDYVDLLQRVSREGFELGINWE